MRDLNGWRFGDQGISGRGSLFPSAGGQCEAEDEKGKKQAFHRRILLRILYNEFQDERANYLLVLVDK
ncbi:MAG: hypothetical protein C4583_07180 [Anaerolineaceae bacterium]|nr:MAG: hypothetical protein C4583_07180 [Anaerolineaceae bacterium]